jgi:hypothetical protein
MITYLFKLKMIEKAKEHGIIENFGQKEIQKLKDKYGYDQFGTSKEREMAKVIDELDDWCMNFDDIKLQKYE